MPAYMFIKTKVTDREQYMKYVEAAQPLAAKHGRKFLVLSQPVEILEGSASTFGLKGSSDQWATDYLLVSEWPSAKVAREFWNSVDYAEDLFTVAAPANLVVTILQHLSL